MKRAFANDSVTRISELAKEDYDIKGPAALARLLRQSTQSVHNWGRSKTGVSQRGAITAQEVCGWSAEYILKGVGAKRVRSSIGDLLGAPVEVPREMIK